MSWRDEFIAHAQSVAPREACAVLSGIRGKPRLSVCRNLASDENDFIVDSADYAKILDDTTSAGGDVLALVHSHVNSPENPTHVDLATSYVLCVPGVIYSLLTQRWHRFIPPYHEDLGLVGRVYHPGVFDCYAAVRDWYRVHRGVKLRNYTRDHGWWERGENLLDDNYAREGFVDVTGSELQHGDVILMSVRAGGVPNHCAVYLDGGKIYHHATGRLSGHEVYSVFHRNATTRIVRRA